MSLKLAAPPNLAHRKTSIGVSPVYIRLDEHGHEKKLQFVEKYSIKL
jgi:hypothetical protein